MLDAGVVSPASASSPPRAPLSSCGDVIVLLNDDYCEGGRERRDHCGGVTEQVEVVEARAFADNRRFFLPFDTVTF